MVLLASCFDISMYRCHSLRNVNVAPTPKTHNNAKLTWILLFTYVTWTCSTECTVDLVECTKTRTVVCHPAYHNTVQPLPRYFLQSTLQVLRGVTLSLLHSKIQTVAMLGYLCLQNFSKYNTRDGWLKRYNIHTKLNVHQ
jgi:hypothetical protein